MKIHNDLDDDFIEDLDEDEVEEDWDEDELSQAEPDRRLLIGLGVVGVVILIAAIILFVLFLNSSRKERESMETQLGLWEEIPEEE